MGTKEHDEENAKKDNIKRGASAEDHQLHRQKGQDDETYVRRNFWSKVRRYSAKIPFLKDALALYYCAVDPKTSKWAKLIAFGGLAYFILPFDAIPDFLVVAGWTDDAAILAGVLKTLSTQVKDEHREKAKEWVSRKKRMVVKRKEAPAAE